MSESILAQKIRAFGVTGFVYGYVVAIGKDKMGFSFVPISDNSEQNKCNLELAYKIAYGRAKHSRKPLTLDSFKKLSAKYIKQPYINFCENELTKQMFEEGGKKTVREVMTPFCVENNWDMSVMIDPISTKKEKTGFIHFEKKEDGVRKTDVRLTPAEIIYPYLVVMKNRMDRYYK